MSSIGPKSRKTITELIGREAAKERAITASELEHKELAYAISIIAGIATKTVVVFIFDAGSAPSQTRIIEATVVPNNIIGINRIKSA